MRFFFVTLLSLFPQISFAVETPTTFKGVMLFVFSYVELIIPIIVLLSVTVFIFGLVKFIARVGGNEAEIENGKKLMVYGIIGLFVMTTLWAIVGFFFGEFNFGDLLIPQLPESSFTD